MGIVWFILKVGGLILLIYILGKSMLPIKDSGNWMPSKKDKCECGGQIVYKGRATINPNFSRYGCDKCDNEFS